MRKRFLIPLLTVLALPTAVNAQSYEARLTREQWPKSISFLKDLIGKPKLVTILCSTVEDLKNTSFEDKWDSLPWIYNPSNGKLYDYDVFLNEISPLNEWRSEGDIFTYKSKIEDNYLKILESEKNLKYPDQRYLIDLKAMTYTSYSVDNPEDKNILRCEKLDFPKGVKINY